MLRYRRRRQRRLGSGNEGTVVAGFEDGFSYRFGPGGGDVFMSDWALVYDKGPGPDGIPGCIGDNVNTLNGANACDQRLGFGSGRCEDRTRSSPPVRTIARSCARWVRDHCRRRLRSSSGATASAATVAYFGLAQNPPTTNTIAAFTLRDLNVFVARSADVLVKVSTTQCPLTNAGPQCEPASADPCRVSAATPMVTAICDNVDNCPTIANPDQEDGAGGLEVTIAGASARMASATPATTASGSTTRARWPAT